MSSYASHLQVISNVPHLKYDESGLRVNRWTAEPLNCHGLLDKLDCPNVIDLISKHDIFCVSETWIRENDQVYIPGFEYFPLNRKKCKGPIKGGIGLFIRDNLRDFIKMLLYLPTSFKISTCYNYHSGKFAVVRKNNYLSYLIYCNVLNIDAVFLLMT